MTVLGRRTSPTRRLVVAAATAGFFLALVIVVATIVVATSRATGVDPVVGQTLSESVTVGGLTFVTVERTALAEGGTSSGMSLGAGSVVLLVVLPLIGAALGYWRASAKLRGRRPQEALSSAS